MPKDRDANRMNPRTTLQSAEVVVPCEALQPNIDFFVSRLGFRLDRISPADAPRMASISGHGLRLLLRRGRDEPAPTLRVVCEGAESLGATAGILLAPCGARIECTTPDAEMPPLTYPHRGRELVVQRAAEDDWQTGRAGMLYRDLVPGRLGGHFIASEIRILDGGPVPDQVHYHAVKFQLIYCAKGWVRVVYEGQGPAFVLHPGDAVLQPPGLRHRVLESSAGLEVVEISVPAEHDTFVDHDLDLPTNGPIHPDRDLAGQRFVHHVAETAPSQPWPQNHSTGGTGWTAQDLGIATATAGLAAVRAVRSSDSASQDPTDLRHDGELVFLHVLAGSLTLHGEAQRLSGGDSLVIPPQVQATIEDPSADLQLLEVRFD